MPPPAIADPNATPPTPDAPDPGVAVGVMPASEVPSDVISSESDRNDRHFRTDHLLDDLKGRSIRGGAVTLTAQAAKFVLKLGETIVLARLLTPADFGLVAMVTAITGMVAMFKDAGLSMATVQRARITHEQVSTLFWINVALSLALMLVVAALAPLVVWLYGEPRLLGITLAVSGSFIFAGLSVQHTALLKRQMRFTSLATVDLTSMALAVSVALLMAWYGAGYWALVGLLVTQPIFQFVMVWRLSGWRPGLPRRSCGVRPMLGFGGNVTGFEFINYFSRNADNMLIGWYWGAGALGLYTRAYALMMLPVANIRVPISAVAMPALSRLVSEPARYRAYYRKMLSLLAFLSMPMAVLIFLTTDRLIPLALGESWSGAIPILRILAITGFIQPIANLRGLVQLSCGRADKQLHLGAGLALVTVIGFVAGLPWGPVGVATAYVICTYGTLYPSLRYTFRNTPLRIADFNRSVANPAIASITAGLLGYLAATGFDLGHDAIFVGVIVVGYIVLYVISFSMLPGGRAELRGFLSMSNLAKR